jgi:hypothetical protein
VLSLFITGSSNVLTRNLWALWRLYVTYRSPLAEKRNTFIQVSRASSGNCGVPSGQKRFTLIIKRFSVVSGAFLLDLTAKPNELNTELQGEN